MNLFNHHFTDLAGNPLYLSRYRNQPFLVVNIATESPFTPQLSRLQQIYAQNQRVGLEILAIPCVDFGDEEPRNEEEIAKFLREEYPVNFLVTERCSVNGREMHRLFREMLQEFTNEILPRGNFHKYLFDRSGQLVRNWPPNVLPDDPTLLHEVNKHLTSKHL